MPTEYRTKVVVEGRTEGFQQAGQEAERLNKEVARSASMQAKEAIRAEQQLGRMGRAMANLGHINPMRKLSDSAKDYKEQLENIEKQMADLAREQLRLSDAMMRTEKGTQAYTDLESQLKETAQAERDLEQHTRRMERAHRDEAAAVRQVRQEIQQMQGAFTQGFLQGAFNGPFIQRGPGAARQAAGMAVGGAARRGAAGVMGMMGAGFTGVGGLAQGLAGIPIVGGAAAAQVQMAAGFAQQALGFEQQMMQAAPFLGLQAADPRSVARARQQARARFGTRGGRDDEVTFVKSAEIDAELARRRAAAGPVRGAGTNAGLGAMGGWAGASLALTAERGAQDAMLTRESVRRDILAKRREEGVAAGAQAVARVRAASPRARFMAAMRDQGVNLGMTQQEMMQNLAGVAQAGGGTFEDIQAQGMMGRAGAAARFGLGPEVAGAFMQAGRRGGLVGGQGRAGAAMEDALANAMRLGLEGSEIVDYMQQVAEGIQAWRQTGIPLNEQSIGRIGAGMAGLGLGGVRGGVVSRGVQQYGQRLAQQGPQGGVDILALQTLGGVTGRGGLAEYVRGMQRMEEMDFGPEEIQKLFAAYTRAGAGSGQTEETQAAGAITFRKALQRMGINMGYGEIGLLQARQRGENLTPDQEAQLQRAMGGQARGASRADKLAAGGGMVGAAEQMVPESVRRQAAISNMQLDSGRRSLTAVQNLEASAVRMNNVFTKTMGPALSGFTDFLNSGTKGLGTFITKIQKGADVMEAFHDAVEMALGPR